MNSMQAAREKLGLSQEALAEGLGCSQGAISHWEVGRTTPTPEQARKYIAFAALQGVALTFDEIYALHDEKSPA